MNQILVVNKEKGLTSRDVVNLVSQKLGTKKIGHTGTLDPLATGVLVLLVGRYTKLNELFSSMKKEYIATVQMGYLTDTLDVLGTVVKKEEKIPTKEVLEEVFRTFPRTYLQEVPLYSAIKVKGKKLYQYAREGKEVVLPKKEVTLYELELLSVEKMQFTFRALVSKGTYIRSLIRDLGDACHSLFTMSELQRTKQGLFDIKEALSLESISKESQGIRLEDVVWFPKEVVDKELEKKIKNGCQLENKNGYEKVLFLSSSKEPLAIYKKEGPLLCVDVMIGSDEE